MDELIQLLEGYIRGARTLEECAEWLAGVDWDSPDLTEAAKETLGLFELLVTEVAEGLRDEPEFWGEAFRFVANSPSRIYSR